MAILAYLSKKSKLALLTVGLGIILVLGLLDYLSGAEVSFALFYLLPVATVAWCAGRPMGLLASLASSITWLMADVMMRAEPYSHWFIPGWNAASRFIFFVVVATLLVELRAKLEQEIHFARIDYMTGAINARAFVDILATETLRTQRYHHPLSIAYLDVDNFKAVNDQCGHQEGDRVLRTMFETMRDALRPMDVIARLGGDEFAVLLPEAGCDAAEAAALRVQQRLLRMAQEHGWPITFSIGLLTCNDLPHTVDDLLRKVDGLMYRVKKSGKNGIEHERCAPTTSAFPGKARWRGETLDAGGKHPATRCEAAPATRR